MTDRPAAGGTESAAAGVRPLVVLCGPMGSGKTSVGGALAARRHVTLRDSDHDVEARAGRTVAQIFAADGEAAFRQAEHEAVLAALAEHDGVLALGGGAVLHEGTRRALADYAARGGVVVFLDVGPDAAARRVGKGRSRPLLSGDPRGRWIEIMSERRPVYEAVATLRVVTDGRSPADLARQIDRHLPR